jgi:glycosyltransferase involved in cell wall biosynthesis
MKKVLFFVSDYKIGVSSLLTEQAMCLSDLTGLEFIFIGGDKEQVPGLIDKYDKNKTYLLTGLDDHQSYLRLFSGIKAIVERDDIGVVHVQNNWQLLLVLPLKLFFMRLRIIYTIHGFRHNYRLRSVVARFLIGSILLLFVDKVIAASTIVKSKFKMVGDKVALLYLGVDQIFFNDLYVLDESSFVVVFPAQFRFGKNQDILIRVIGRIVEETGDSTIRLLLPGEGPLKQDCTRLSRDLGLSGCVEFPGLLDKHGVFNLYVKSTIAVIPTNFETFGHCIAEPFVMGRCVVARNVGVATDIIRNADNGFLFDIEEELYDILIKLYNDRSLLRKCGSKAYEERYKLSWKNISAQYERIVAAV